MRWTDGTYTFVVLAYSVSWDESDGEGYREDFESFEEAKAYYDDMVKNGNGYGGYITHIELIDNNNIIAQWDEE